MRALIRKAVAAALTAEAFRRPAEVSVTLTDNASIHALNKAYRGVDRPTDVLSFPLSEDGEYDTDGEAALLGDIVISLEKTEEQAAEYGHSFERELAFLTVHSMLHLLGYDHETSREEEKEMFRRQEEILISLGLGREPDTTE